MIRRMTEADLPAAADLEQRYFSVPWTLEGLLESFRRPEYLFLVVEEEGKVIGYAGLSQVLDEGDVTKIVVDEAYQGRGLGTLLVNALLQEGEKRGIQTFTLEVRAGNRAAIHVYEKLGFEVEGVRRRFYERPVEDALIMWKREPEQ